MAIPKVMPQFAPPSQGANNPFQSAGAGKSPSATQQPGFAGGIQKVQGPQFQPTQKLGPAQGAEGAVAGNLNNPSMKGGGYMPGAGVVATRLDINA